MKQMPRIFSLDFRICAYEGVFVVYLYFSDGAGTALLASFRSGKLQEKKFF